MAAITCLSLDDLYARSSRPPPRAEIIAWVKHAERRNFPRSEIFDFDTELKKRNVESTVVLDKSLVPNSETVVAYLVFTRVHRTALLHKICVMEEYRRQGIARKILSLQIDKMRGRNCDRILLWVDETRMPARCLYAGLGFKNSDRIEDYYASGRHGIQMTLQLVPNELEI